MTKYISLAKVLIQDSIRHQVKYFGIEGLEDAIKRNFHGNEKAKQAMLKEYYEMYGKKS